MKTPEALRAEIQNSPPEQSVVTERKLSERVENDGTRVILTEVTFGDGRVRVRETRARAAMQLGALSFSTETSRLLATEKQLAKLRRMGWEPGDLSLEEASELIDRLLRPAEYAMSQTFKGWRESLAVDERKAALEAIAAWDHCPHLPRYGPHATWAELRAGTVRDPDATLSEEEKQVVMFIVAKTVDPQSFIDMKLRKKSAYKEQLDDWARGHLAR